MCAVALVAGWWAASRPVTKSNWFSALPGQPIIRNRKRRAFISNTRACIESKVIFDLEVAEYGCDGIPCVSLAGDSAASIGNSKDNVGIRFDIVPPHYTM
jgi:hypothetical protein